jgi:hypothetical protein
MINTEKKQRNLPRYEVLHLKPRLFFPALETKEFYVKDISLAGLQIYCPTEISLKSFNQVTFKLGNQQEFKLNVHQVWGEELESIKEEHAAVLKEKSKDIVYRTGLRLKFFNKENYNSWLKLIMAIHKTQSKKRKTD